MKKTLFTIATATTALLFSSCANPYDPAATNAVRNTATGGLIGAGAGALIGNASDNAFKGALIGGAGGALIGNQVGQRQDALQSVPNNVNIPLPQQY